MRKTITVTLADKEFLVRPLTLGTIRAIDLLKAATVPTDSVERERHFFDQYLQVLALALGEGAPEVTVDLLLTLRVTLEDIINAHQQIMVHSGLVKDPQKDQPTPQADNPATGPSSTAG